MFKKTAIIAGLGLALSATAQADYNWEAGMGISGGDRNSIEVDGQYFFGGVDDSKGPYGEAEFLDHASYVGVNYNDGELDDDLGDLETEAYGIDGRFVTEDAGWILQGGYQRVEPEFSFGDAEIDVFNVGVGKYLTDTTTLVISYQNQDIDELGDVDSYRLDLDHMFNWGDSGLKLHAAYGLVDLDNRDDVDIYEVDATWYPCKNFGIGAAYSTTEELADEIEEYGVFAEYFISQSVSVGLSYFEGELDDSDFETDSYMVDVNVRF